MPTLPSGRRVEFSLDRFHALLEGLPGEAAHRLVDQLVSADDLLFVMDAVHFGLADGNPYFAGYLAADWSAYAADWSSADRQALQGWLLSADARAARAEAIDYIRELYLGNGDLTHYPYLMAVDWRQAGMVQGSRLRQ